MSWLNAFPIPATTRLAAAGELLLWRHTVPREAIYLKTGRVAAGWLESGVLRNLLGDCNAPCWLDVGTALAKRSSVADYVTEQESQILLFPADALRRWFATQPKELRAMLQDLAAAQRQQAEAMLGLMVQDAEARFAQWLLRHAERIDHGQVAVPLRERKRAIAARLGIAPETLSRLLRHLRDLGLVSQSGSTMHLVDPVGLKRLASMQGLGPS